MSARDWLTVGVISVAGLLLRLICARGGLWLDEAWSVLLAHEVGTPAGVFLSINHDNNHYLNSLWLQWVGIDAPPLAQRALAIATGTMSIPAAAAVAARHGRWPALATALIFATSPILVTLGSEARGYAPMSLCLLLAMILLDKADAEGPAGERPLAMTLCFLLGALSQMTMVIGVAALVGAAVWKWWERGGARFAVGRAAGLFGPALLALAGMLAILWAVALRAPGGFHFGSHEAFTVAAWFRALVELIGFTIGAPVLSPLLIVGALAILVLAAMLGARRLPFYTLAIVAFPLSVAAAGTINPGHARYYLVAGIALLLMLGEILGRLVSREGRARITGVVALVLLVVAGLIQDAVLATNRRADPFAAITALRARAPHGALVLFDRQTGADVLRVAATQAGYRLTAAKGSCPTAPFAFLDRHGQEALPQRIERCGSMYRTIASAHVRGMSGTHWALYQRDE